MSKEENIRTYNEWIDAQQAHDIKRMLTFLTDDVRIKNVAFAEAKGKQEAAADWQGTYDAFPNFHMNPITVMADEDRIVVEIEMSGTHKGTRQKFVQRGAFFIDFSGNKIRSITTYYDPSGIPK